MLTCQKNFKNLTSISEDTVINLAPLNDALMEVNKEFVSECAFSFSIDDRLTIGEALLLEL